MARSFSYGEYHVNETATQEAVYGDIQLSQTTPPPQTGTMFGVIPGLLSAPGFTGWASIEGQMSGTISGLRCVTPFQGWVNAVRGTIWGRLPTLKGPGPTPIPARMTGRIDGAVTGDGIMFGVIRGLVVAEGAFDGRVTHAITGAMSGAISGVRGCTVRGRMSGIMKGFRLKNPAPRFNGTVSRYSVELANLTRRPSTLVTIALDYCQRTFGDAPCYGSGTPCYNTRSTCKYLAAYDPAPKDYTFCLHGTPVALPGEVVRPYLKEVKQAALEIVQKENSIINSKATLTFFDEPDSDIGVDPYRIDDTTRQATGGTEIVTTGGTFWRKLLRRNHYYQGRRLTIRHGFDVPGPTLADYVVDFVGVIEDVRIDGRGAVTVTAKGLLQMADVQIPRKTDGKLYVPITADASALQLAPWSGVDMVLTTAESKYAASGLIKIGREIIAYSGLELNQSTGTTTFTGLARGQYNAYGWDMPQPHDKDDQVQQVEAFDGNPLDIMVDLLRRAGIADDDIDLAAFESIRTEHLPAAYFAAIIDEPVKIKTLLRELREQTMVNIWQDATQRITAGYMAPLKPWQTYRRITDQAHIVYQSSVLDEQADERVSRATVYYDHIAGEKLDQDQFWHATEYRDADAEGAHQYGEVKAREPILSRWIWSRHGGADHALWIAGKAVDMQRNGAPRITFDLELKDSALAVGDIFEAETGRITDEQGAPEVRRYMAVKRERVGRNRYRYQGAATGLEGRFLMIAPDDFPATWNAASSDQQAYGCTSDNTGRAPDYAPGFKIV